MTRGACAPLVVLQNFPPAPTTPTTFAASSKLLRPGGHWSKLRPHSNQGVIVQFLGTTDSAPWLRFGPGKSGSRESHESIKQIPLV